MIEKILSTAKSQIGYRENLREQSHKVRRWYGMDGNPWCAMFTSWVYAEAVFPCRKCRTAPPAARPIAPTSKGMRGGSGNGTKPHGPEIWRCFILAIGWRFTLGLLKISQAQNLALSRATPQQPAMPMGAWCKGDRAMSLSAGDFIGPWIFRPAQGRMLIIG